MNNCCDSYGNANVAAFLPLYGGNILANVITGTLATGLQPNITVVGPLTGVTTTGNIRGAGNLLVTSDITTTVGNMYVPAGSIFVNNTVVANGIIFSSSNIVTDATIVAFDADIGNRVLANSLWTDHLLSANGTPYLPTYSGNITADSVSATGNIITDSYFIGGSALLVNLSVSGNILANTVSTSGNITIGANGYFVGNGAYLTGITANLSGNLSGNILANGFYIKDLTGLTVNGNIQGGNLSTFQGVSIAGNVTTSLWGNINAGNGYVFGNGALLSGISGSSIANGTSNIGIFTANGNILMSVANTANVVSISNTTMSLSGNIITTGNANIGNISTFYGTTTTGNVTTDLYGNIVGNVISAQGAVYAASISAQGNIQGGNLSTFLGTSTAGNVTVSLWGNIDAGNGYVFGNGALLTSLPGGSFIANGTSNISIATANGNILMSVANTANVVSISNTTVSLSGNIITTGNANIGNITTFYGTTTTGNVTTDLYGNIAVNTVSAQGAVYAATISASGNILGGNLSTFLGTSTAGNVTTSLWGNIDAGNGYVFGNGALLSGISGGSSISNGTSNIGIFTANGNILMSVANTANVVSISNTTVSLSGNIITTGNANIGNITTFYGTTTTGNVTTNLYGNIVGNVISAQGNILGNNISALGNIIGNNIVISNNLSGNTATFSGNVTASTYFGDGSQLTGIAPTVQVYEFANVTANVNGYYNAVWLANFTAGNVANISSVVTTTPVNIASYITQPGYPGISVIPSGTILTHIETIKDSGPRGYHMYAEIWSRTQAGAETLIARSDDSTTATQNITVQQNLVAYIAQPVTIATTDRIVTKIYAYMDSGSDTITISFDGTTGAGLQLPALPVTISTLVPYTGATSNVDLGTFSLSTTGNIFGNAFSANLIQGNASNVAGNVISGNIPLITATGNTTGRIYNSNKTFDDTIVTNDNYWSANQTSTYVIDQLLNIPDLPPVNLATTANVTKTGLTAIDGVTPTATSLILVKNQTNNDNGVWLAQSGAWVRQAFVANAYTNVTTQTTYANLNINSGIVNVLAGTANKNLQYQITVANPQATFGNSIVYVTATTKIPTASANNRFVDISNGNDTNNNGSSAYPFATITRALTGASYPLTITVGASGGSETSAITWASGNQNSLVQSQYGASDGGQTQLTGVQTFGSGSTRNDFKATIHSTGGSAPFVFQSGAAMRNYFQDLTITTTASSWLSLNVNISNWITLNNISVTNFNSIALPAFVSPFTIYAINQTNILPINGTGSADTVINIQDCLEGTVRVAAGFLGTINWNGQAFGGRISGTITDQASLDYILNFTTNSTLDGYYLITGFTPTSFQNGAIIGKQTAVGITQTWYARTADQAPAVVRDNQNFVYTNGALTTFTGVSVTGNVTTSLFANIYGGYLFGNGSQLTGVGGGYSIANGTSNVGIFTANGNITMSVANVANVVTISNTEVSLTGNITTLGNATIGNISTFLGTSVAGNVTTSLWGNINAGNGYVFGNGALLSGISGGYSISNGTSNVGIFAANGNITMSVANVANVVSISNTEVSLTGNIITTGNANIGNITTFYGVSIAGNVTTSLWGNINVGNGYIIGNGSQLTGIGVSNGTSTINIPSVNGNINFVVGNVVTGYLSANTVSWGNLAGAVNNGGNAVAIGYQAGRSSQGSQGVAIGYLAGLSSQGGNAVALGTQAGSLDQGSTSIAIGIGAGQQGQNANAIAIGQRAGQLFQGGNSIAIGAFAGDAGQPANTIILNATGTAVNTSLTNSLFINPIRNVLGNVANVLFYNVDTKEVSYANTISLSGNITGSNLSTFYGTTTTGNVVTSLYGNIITGNIAIVGNISIGGTVLGGVPAIANGTSNIGFSNANGAIQMYVNGTQSGNITPEGRLNLGYQSAQTLQGNGAVAIGSSAGYSAQGNTAVALGYIAGYQNQGVQGVAIGDATGSQSQGSGAVAIGASAGYSAQGNTAVSIGWASGVISQGANAVAMGIFAGRSLQGTNSIALGVAAGTLSQSANSVAIGYQAGASSQGLNAIAIGVQSGTTSQSANSIAIGVQTATTNQSPGAIAIGLTAATSGQGLNGIAIGVSAGGTNQSGNAIAIGTNAGQGGSGNSVAIGTNTGSALGINSVAVGANIANVAANVVALNATGNTLTANISNALFIAPVRYSNTVANVVYYNTATKEMYYGNVESIIQNGTSNVNIATANGAVTISANSVSNVVSVAANLVTFGANTSVAYANVSNVASANASLAYYPLVLDSTGSITKQPVIATLSPVIDNTLTTPPASPAVGDAYLVPASGATGAWAGQGNKIATWTGSVWSFYTPTTNDQTSVLSGTNAGNVYLYSGSAWVLQTVNTGVPIYNWSLSGSYALGTVVLYQSALYQANAAIPANTAFVVGTTGATWKALGTTSVAEYGESALATNVTVPASNVTPQTVDVLSFTLPTAGVWEVSYSFRGSVTTGGSFMFAFLANSTNTAVANSAALVEFIGVGASSYQATTTQTVRITTTGSTVYKLRATASGDAFASLVVSDSSGVTKVVWNKISGFTAQSASILNSGVYTSSTIPTAAAAGAGGRVFVTDSLSSGFGAGYTGGGSNKVPVYSTGTAWIVG